MKREETETARQLLRRSLYAADMQLAQAAWNSKSILRMRELLERQQPGPGEADLRGFEWDYLRRESSTFRTFRPLANAVGGLMSPDARTFVHVVKVPAPGAVGQEFRLRRWDTASGRELRGFDPFPGETAIIHLSHDWFSPDGKRFAFVANVRDTAGRERWKLKVWEWESGRELFSLPEVPTTTVLAFDPSGARLAFAIPAPGDEPRCDLTIREIEGGKELVKNSLPTAKEFTPRSITFNPDGGRLAIVMGRIRTDPSSESPPVFAAMVLAAGSGQELLRLGAGQGSLMQFSPDGKRLAVSNQVPSSKLIVRDASSGEEVLHLTPEIDDLFLFKDIAFSPDGSRLASAGHDGKLRIWDVAGAGATPERRPALILEGSDSPLDQLAWSVDGRSVSTSNYSGMILTWELAAGEGLLRQKGMLAGTPSCSVDVSRFAAPFRISSDETEVRVWNQAGQVLFTARDDTHEDEEPNIRHRRVELSPDGRRLAYLTLDYLVEAGKKKRVGRLRTWDLDGRKEIFRRDGDRGCFDRAAFSPDGKRLACVWFTSRDTAGKRSSRMSVWDLETRKEVHQMEVPTWAYGSRLAFSPDGLRLAAAMKGASEFKTQLVPDLGYLDGKSGPVPGVARRLHWWAGLRRDRHLPGHRHRRMVGGRPGEGARLLQRPGIALLHGPPISRRGDRIQSRRPPTGLDRELAVSSRGRIEALGYRRRAGAADPPSARKRKPRVHPGWTPAGPRGDGTLLPGCRAEILGRHAPAEWAAETTKRR